MRVEVRADFVRKGFCLYVNGEAIGHVFRRYKFALMARDWLLSEVESWEA